MFITRIENILYSCAILFINCISDLLFKEVFFYNVQNSRLLQWSYGVMAITVDFESTNPSSSLGRTFLLNRLVRCYQKKFSKNLQKKIYFFAYFRNFGRFYLKIRFIFWLEAIKLTQNASRNNNKVHDIPSIRQIRVLVHTKAKCHNFDNHFNDENPEEVDFRRIQKIW